MHTDDPLWTPAHRARWGRVEAHPVGGADAAKAFVQRLAREQAWSLDRAEAALLEYRRFAFLCCIAGHEVTPSRAVDAVWHLHLIYTRDYWDQFCRDTLDATLHHDPGAGHDDAARHRWQYRQTLDLYRRYFGPPPESFWPQAHGAASLASQARSESPRRTPRWRRWVAAAALLLPALASAQYVNPLDWNGADFLALYLILLPAALVAGLALRYWLRRQMQPTARTLGAMAPLEVAMLVGGPMRVVDAGVAALHAEGVLRWDEAQQKLVRNDASRSLDPIEAAVLGLATGRLSDARTVHSAARAMEPLRDRLERRGLWFEQAAARRIAQVSAMPMLAVLALGGAKVGLGIMRDRPVTLLVVLGVLAAIVALVLWFSRPARTPSGDQERARLMRDSAKAPDRPTRDRSSNDLALAVALGGTAILAGTALSGYHTARAASPSSDSGTSSSESSSESSSSDSGSDGGSSCGGCGGGGGD
jgi:uncharacterized protein (TIGR04222 family)